MPHALKSNSDLALNLDQVRSTVRTLWSNRKPVLAVFGPCGADFGYASSDFSGCTHNSRNDAPLPIYKGQGYAFDDTPTRLEALRRLAVKRLAPGDLALVRMVGRHGHGFNGYTPLKV